MEKSGTVQLIYKDVRIFATVLLRYLYRIQECTYLVSVSHRTVPFRIDQYRTGNYIKNLKYRSYL
jgi:hypothetical protein